MINRQFLTTLIVLASLSALPQVAWAKPKKAVSVEAAVTSESRLKDWNKESGAKRGTPEHLCDSAYGRLTRVQEYFAGLDKKFSGLTEQQKKRYGDFIKPNPPALPEEISDDPDWWVFKLQTKVQSVNETLSRFSGPSGWSQQEQTLKTFLAEVRGKAPYTVAQQSEPFDALKDLLKLKRALASVFNQMDQSESEWNRLLAFDLLAKLASDDKEKLAEMRETVVTESIDAVMECHLDYLSNF